MPFGAWPRVNPSGHLHPWDHIEVLRLDVRMVGFLRGGCSGGRFQLGRIGRTLELIGESFRVLMADKELIWFPLFSGIACLAVSVVMLSGGALAFLPQIKAMGAAGAGRPALSQGMWLGLLLFYLVNYFIVIFFNVALVSVAFNRIGGGQANLNDGLQVAWQRKWTIFQWALLDATVGILLRSLEERMGWLGRIVMDLIGIAWNLATYFIVPILAMEDLGPAAALSRSAELFRETWGEELVGGFSFGLIFTLLALPGIFLPVMGAGKGRTTAIAGVVLALVYWLFLAIISSTVQGVFTAALYRYATTRTVPPGFSAGSLLEAWQPRQ
ncbi:MAG TPA: DUF6159 family protein [Candidatus Dormibacteraeota bacterium]|nr:DUF6159 family protein [Candidatus Dormibacteraeota bacterium]